MNTSNRFDIETIARQRQAEIEMQLRKNSLLSDHFPTRAAAGPKVKRIARMAFVSIAGVVAWIIAASIH